jgi:hypothetical protein
LKQEKPSDWSDFDWLWVKLSQAVHDCPPGESVLERHATRPWQSKDQAVLDAWGKITDPRNRAELERRLRNDLNPLAEEYSRMALEICIRRNEEQQR